MRSLLLRRLAPLLVVLAVAGSACSSAEPRAATVNGKTISARSVQDELKAIRGNTTYRKVLENPQQGYGITLAGASKGTFNSAFSAQALTLRIYYSLIEQDLAKRGVKVTAADEKSARTSVKGGIDSLGKGVWAKFPESYRNQLVHQEALVAKATSLAAKTSSTEKVDVACVSHILISIQSHPDADAKAIADRLKAQLAGGADFATLAKANSEDPGSKDSGGDLGCQPKGAYVPEFEQAVASLPVGKVSDPVKTQFGYHLILVRSRKKQAPTPTAQSSQQATSDYLLKLMCGAKTKVEVDPRFGSWDRSSCTSKQALPSVKAPKQPAKSSSK